MFGQSLLLLAMIDFLGFSCAVVSVWHEYEGKATRKQRELSYVFTNSCCQHNKELQHLLFVPYEPANTLKLVPKEENKSPMSRTIKLY